MMQKRVYSRREVLKLTGLAGVALMGSGLFAGCSSGASSQAANSAASESASAASATSATSEAASEAASAASIAAASAAALSGKELNIYCGAGMTDPFTEIAKAFEAETGCKMNVTYANAAQIQTQIDTTQEGDFFVAGSAEELKPVEQYVESSTNLVKHIPVLAIPEANPKNVQGLADLAGVDSLLVGDPESTPIGKIAKKALADLGLWEGLQAKGAITTTTTAPQIATALANGEGDAGIVWKENVKANGAAIVDTPDLDDYVKVVPAAMLASVADQEAADAFVAYLQTPAAQDIWKSYGYELA